MADFTVSLLRTNQEAPDVLSFHFDTKAQTFSYQAGQFLRLTLPGVTNDPRGASRFFSIASSPTEKDFLIIATKRSQSPFKKKLASLTVGETVTVSGPFGKFTLTDNANKLHVFLSGGIGITPFRSILKFVTDEKLIHKIILLYSNRTPDDIVFKEDLERFSKENPNLAIIHTFTRLTEQESENNEAIKQFNNNGRVWEMGRINGGLIKGRVKDLNNATFYICGPPTMVESLLMVVKGMGVAEENIKLERFTGYQ